MKAIVFVLLLTLSTLGTGLVHAGERYEDIDSHPLRVVSYVVHPVGFGLEWLVFRPLHFIVSRPGLDRVFGHGRIADQEMRYEPLRAPGYDAEYTGY